MSAYHYTECGLPNVYISGLYPVRDADGDEVIEVPMINDLHRSIAQGIVSHEKGMSAPELRFLRTEMGLTQAELANLVHRERQAVGHWERGAEIDGAVETVIRLLATERLGLDGRADGIEGLAKSSVPTAEIQPINIEYTQGGYHLAA